MKKYPDFSILIVDDEPAWLRSMQMMLLRSASLTNIIPCSDSRQVMNLLRDNDVGLVLLDLTMPHRRGAELLAEIGAAHPDVLVIIITGLNFVDEAVTCMKAGAFDYFVKTWGEERLSTGILHAVRLIEAERKNRETARGILREELAHPEAFAAFTTSSRNMLNIFRYIEAIAPSHYPVLITGESGCGKELVARAIHAVREEAGRFVSVNMASLDGQMLEDTLFGHAKGAFTSASGARGGLVEEAHGGTLFLDEIGELSPASQAKLLRFLQEGEYYALGSDKPQKVSARIVLATNQDLVARQKEGLFRQDLYYRLKTHHIHVPPLRERKEDIALLARHFVMEAAKDLGRQPPAVGSDLLLSLTHYSYPGNVRELKAMITHAVSLGGESLSRGNFSRFTAERFVPEAVADAEQALLRLFMQMDGMPSFAEVKNIMTAAAMTKTDGNQSAAAKLLGISQPAMSKRVKN